MEGGKWGYINKMGQPVFDREFDKTSSFINGKGNVIIEGQVYEIDKVGNLKKR